MWRDAAWLFDIVRAATKARDYLADMSLDDFLNSTLHQDAVLRQLEIIGEATKRLSSETRDRYPTISWRKVAGLRNVLIHEYDRIDLPLIWRIVHEDLGPLIDAIEPTLPPPDKLD